MHRLNPCPRESLLLNSLLMPKIASPAKVWMFLTLLPLGFLFLGYHSGGRLGLFIGFLVASGFQIFISLPWEKEIPQDFHHPFPTLEPPSSKKHQHRKLLRKKTRDSFLGSLRPYLIEGHDPWGLGHIVEKYQSSFSFLKPLNEPRIFIANRHEVFSLSLVGLWQRPIIVLSSGLLKVLTASEIEAVLVYEFCHVTQLSTFFPRVCHVLAFSFLRWSLLLNRVFFFVPEFLSQILWTRWTSLIAWILLKFSTSEAFFLKNDEMVARLLKDRRSIAQALWKMGGFCHQRPVRSPLCYRTIFSVNPVGSGWSPHPPVGSRIQRLLGYFPL